MDRRADYELLSRIASGGMAEIWVARRRDGVVCVLKRLLPVHLEDDEYLRMFHEEGRLGARLVHPNLVRTFDEGTIDGTPFLAMEYVHGEDLRIVNRRHRNEERRMPLDVACEIVLQACAGLHHAHELLSPDGLPLELVHRDVSPHNVVLGFDGRVRVVDFGIAKSAHRRWETRHGTLKGKVPYMAPEQIKARRLDRRADIYALGVVLYELVCGRRPYAIAAPGDFALMMAIARHDIRPPRELVPELDAELEAILVRSLAYDPRERFPTMLDLATALDRFATTRRLARGERRVAEYLSELFGPRLEAWRAAERDLGAHVVRIEEERAESQLVAEPEDESATFVARTVAMAPPSSPEPAQFVSASPAVAAVIETRGVTVVTLRGRIDESFDGAALGASLSGTVLFDLAGVERVTSYGVREWLALTGAARADVWLARCSEAFVNQLGLVRAFAGAAHLLSFRVPFLCDDCGSTFSAMLDCERDAATFAPRCPRCGGAARLDDDPAYLSFATPHLGVVPPASVRAALESVEQSDQLAVDAIDKLVTNAATTLRVQREIDRSVRWPRVLDGIEGRLVVDFHGAARPTPEGASNFVHALATLGPDVTDIELVECPEPIWRALDARSRVRVRSVVYAGRCPACKASRSGVGEPSASPRIFCRRCNTPLVVDLPFAPPPRRTVAWAALATLLVLLLLGAITIARTVP